jgi:RNA polymerase-binding transcription factor DksA
MSELGPVSTKDRLSMEKRATLARIASLTDDVEDIDAGIAAAHSDDEHDPEGSTLAFERARISTLLGQDRAYLEEIERAQGRLADGTYGTCEHCGAAIPPERLAARPVARVCVQCRIPSE